MRISSKTGFRGVEKFRDKFKAFYQKGDDRKTIGIFSDAVEAAHEFDKFIVQRKGIGFAFHQLNFPDDYKHEHDKYQAEQNKRAEEERIKTIEHLKNTPIPQHKYPELLRRFNEGATIPDLARLFVTHEEVVVETLNRLERERLASIGIEHERSVQVTKESIREHVSVSRRAGESIRGIAERLSIDRKTITKWLGEE